MFRVKFNSSINIVHILNWYLQSSIISQPTVKTDKKGYKTVKKGKQEFFLEINQPSIGNKSSINHKLISNQSSINHQPIINKL